MKVQLLCDEGAVIVCARVHERYCPTPPHPPPHPPTPPTPKTLKKQLCCRWGGNGVPNPWKVQQYCVADEWKIVVADEWKSGVFWCQIWGRFGVTDEGLTTNQWWFEVMDMVKSIAPSLWMFGSDTGIKYGNNWLVSIVRPHAWFG